jgi:hypothetical protein
MCSPVTDLACLHTTRGSRDDLSLGLCSSVITGHIIPLATDPTGDSASAFAICEAGNRDPVEESAPLPFMKLEIGLRKRFQTFLHGASRPRLPHVESKQASPNQVRCYLEKLDLMSVAYFQKVRPRRNLKPGV